LFSGRFFTSDVFRCKSPLGCKAAELGRTLHAFSWLHGWLRTLSGVTLFSSNAFFSGVTLFSTCASRLVPSARFTKLLRILLVPFFERAARQMVLKFSKTFFPYARSAAQRSIKTASFSHLARAKFSISPPRLFHNLYPHHFESLTLLNTFSLIRLLKNSARGAEFLCALCAIISPSSAKFCNCGHRLSFRAQKASVNSETLGGETRAIKQQLGYNLSPRFFVFM